MRHKKKGRKLGRTASHRRALLKNLAMAFFKKGSIVTTQAKAKEMRKVVEPLITLAKKGTLPSIRLASKTIEDKKVLKKLFEEIGPRYKERPGGYTRIIKIGPRQGDAAPMAIFELVE